MTRFFPRIFFLSLIAALCASPALAQTVPVKPLSDPKSFLTTTHVEGFVIPKLQISETGVVTAYAVEEEYPKGKVLKRDADSAIRALRFNPMTKDGVAVADDPSIAIVVRDMDQPQAVRPLVLKALRAQLAALQRGDTSEDALGEVKRLYDAGKLNVVEAARYFYMLAPIHRMRSEFEAGRQAASKARAVESSLGNKVLNTALRMEEILGLLATNPKKGLESYDSWLKSNSKEGPPPDLLTQLVARFRAAPAADHTATIAALSP